MQAEIERAGIATASITLLPEITRKVRPPRALAVPASFVKTGPGGPFVWVWTGRKAALVKTRARAVGERWTIVEGPAEGAVLLDAEITARPGRLKPGREVKSGGGT